MIDSLFQSLALLLLVQSLGAFWATLRFARYALRLPELPHRRYRPRAVVIVPCKGLEPGLEENISAFCNQDYREYELIFVTESETDPAYGLLAQVIKQSKRPAWLIVAGEANERGQKIHNLVAALDTLNAVDRRVEVLVFADSDTRPARNWLVELVAPLDERRVGAATGFRWYLPIRGGLWTRLLSIWNASALSLLGERSSFAWGGATAIRRENFERLKIRQRWDGALSDDYVLTQAVREAGQRIKFVPACLTVSQAEVDFKELFEFTTRQMCITRTYAPRVWWLTLVTQLLYNFTFWGGMIWCLASKGASVMLALLLIAVFALGIASNYIRIRIAAQLLPTWRTSILKRRWAYVLLGPLVALLYLGNLITSAWSRRIIWRGIGYELISSSETRIWHRAVLDESSTPAAPSPHRHRASARSSLS